MLLLTAEYFRKARLAAKLTTGKLAALAGYKNISKCASAIQGFESSGWIDLERLNRLATVLALDPAEIARLSALDKKRYLDDWNKWADEPVQPTVILRLMAAIYNPIAIPETVKTLVDAEAFARQSAITRRMQVALIWSRRLSIYYNADGTEWKRSIAQPGVINVPYIQIGGRKFIYEPESLAATETDNEVPTNAPDAPIADGAA